MEKKNLSADWEAFRIQSNQQINAESEFRYSSTTERTTIIQALVLWSFSRKITNNEERRKFCLEYLTKKLPSKIKLVAMIECLPDRVWRRLLWKENIDFMSFESFLRRITFTQCIAIEQSFKALYAEHPATPKVMKRTLWNRISNFFTGTNAKTLLAEEYTLSVRNNNKPAWAFNLMHLDFGFSLYPKGEDDDTKITNKKWTRFLSIKEHINDFVVDREFGKYWWFYKTARSNYVLRPKKEVQIKDHVCPGFWATFILHLIFWIASPIAFTIGSIVIIQSAYWNAGAMLLMIPAIITPLWIVIASIKLFVKMLFRIISKIPFPQKLKKPLLNVAKWFGILIIALIVLAVVVFVFIGIGKIICFFVPILGSLLSVAFVMTALFFSLVGVIMFGIILLDDTPDFYRKIPKWIKAIGYVTLVATAVRLLDLYVSDHVVNAIVLCAIWLWEWLSYAPLLFALLFFELCFFGVATWLMTLFFNNPRAFAIAERIISYTIVGMFGIATILFVTGIVMNSTIIADVYYSSPFLSIMCMLGIVLPILLIMMNKKINKENIDAIELASTKISYLMGEMEKLHMTSDKKLIFPESIMLGNHLSQVEFEKLVDRVLLMTKTLFGYYYRTYMHEFLLYILPWISDNVLDKLQKEEKSLCKIADVDERLYYIKLLILGHDDEQRIKHLELERQRKAQKEYKKEKVLGILGAIGHVIAYPFIKIGRFFGWIWQGIREFCLTVKDVWDLFNKRCPYVHKEKLLE